ncbi:hypothetical protein D3C72_2498050 [compost metagenome]
MAGDAFSLADICLAPLVRRCLKFPHAKPELPNVKAWMKRIEDRSAFGTAVAAG